MSETADNARRTGPALEATYQFLLWLVPTLDKFPRQQKFVLGDRIETRTGSVFTDVRWAQKQYTGPGLAAIGTTVRTRETRARTTKETTYYLPSTPLSAARITKVVRAHLDVENGLYRVLDVTMNEDREHNWRDH